MAAAGCAGSVSGLGPRAKARPEAVPTHRHVRCLTLEEARCPVCLEILLEPVTMPCRHSVCLHCFKRTVECSGLCCPLCRLRVSSWARNKQSREKSLVNTELWEMVRQTYPEKCGQRLEQRARVMASEDVFCSPIQKCKTGEMRHEYDKQKNKVMNHEETEERIKKVPCRKKGDCGLQNSQNTSLGVLSDSENEEPIRMRTRHASAFVRRSRVSPAVCRSSYSSFNINVQRSQSCTDSDEGGRKVVQSHLSLQEKASVCHSFNAGILLSSENSRSFSAPVLPLDKRQHWRSVLASPPSLVPHTKPERSVSPESNDSISEELNHFKPIVCSPCTPPKRLPDGRLMEPTIVKSTPRNLTHGLQKNTSYEASPSILQKWKQVELDRQRVKFMSKGTITSPVVDDYSFTRSSEEDQENKSCNCGPMEKDLPGQHCTCTANADFSRKQREKPLLRNKRQLIFDQCIKDDCSQSTTAPTQITLCNSDTHKQCGACEPHCSPSGRMENLKSPILDKHIAVSHNHGKVDLQDLKNEPTVRNCVHKRPTSRRGKKRSQKTKHLEETKRKKRSKIESCDSCEIQYRQNDLHVERIHQERMDRELALKLQRQFDKEGQELERHRTSSDKYPLRSWICVDSRVARNPRRSGRISRRIKHFN